MPLGGMEVAVIAGIAVLVLIFSSGISKGRGA